MAVGVLVAVIVGGLAFLAYKYRWKIVQFINVDHKYYEDIWVDGYPRTVRIDLPEPEVAAEILDELIWSMEELTKYVGKVRPRDRRSKNVRKRFRQENVMEGNPHNNENSTSFTYGKGELTVFCLRHKDNYTDFHDMNTLLFVAIHELAHMASDSYGHNKEFKKNFRWLLKHAVDAGIYIPRDYSEDPVKYCGLTIKNNPLFRGNNKTENMVNLTEWQKQDRYWKPDSVCNDCNSCANL